MSPTRPRFARYSRKALKLLCGAVLISASAVPALGQTLVHSQGASATADDVRAIAQRVQQPGRNLTFSQEANVQRQAEDVLVRRMLAAQAEKDGLERDPLIQTQLRLARERVLSEARLDAIEAAATPKPEALDRYARELYRAEPERFRGGDQWRARHILIGPAANPEARARAQALREEIQKGGSFESLAKQHSTDKGSASKGGDLGWFGPGMMVKEFQAATAALKQPGDLSEVVETQFGYHIIRLEGHRPPGQRSYEDVRKDLEAEVLTKMKAEAKQQAARALLKDAKTEPAAIEALARSYQTP